MLNRCDEYSLGLLFVYVLAEELDETWTSKDIHVLDRVLNFVNGSKFSETVQLRFSLALSVLLQWNPENRCSDLSVVLSILKPYKLNDTRYRFSNVGSLTCSLQTQVEMTQKIGRSNDDVSKAVEKQFGDENYLSFGWTYEETIERDPQQHTFLLLGNESRSPSQAVRGRALFEIAIAYSLGFGTRANVDMALGSVNESARQQYLLAKAVFHVWHDAHSRKADIDEETQLDWPYDATLWGSESAGQVLRRKSETDYSQARQEFH